VDLSGSVLRHGDRVRANGWVVGVDGVTWFGPNYAVPLIFHPPGQQPAPRPSWFGVEVIGVDLTNLARWSGSDDAIEGWATLTGVWRHDRLVVTGQQPIPPRTKHAPSRVRPPCPPPTGGWPEGGVDENIDVPTEVIEQHAVTSVALYRPSRRQVVVVLAAENPSRALAALRARYGARLCVVPSLWSVSQIGDVLSRLRTETRQWLLYTFGPDMTEHGQPFVFADIIRVLPDFAAWARSVPDGLLRVDPWLAPG
jgi:hypothetical protein